MKKMLAVARLDWRRLAFGLISAALIGGLIPSLSDGIGEPVAASAALVAVFVLVGASCGGYFGNDFAEGRSSFFFARPLPTTALVGGRIAALLVLALASYLAFLSSNWVSSPSSSEWSPWILDKRHAYALIVGWAVALFVSLGIAARARDPRGGRSVRELMVIPLRLGASLAAFLLMFGLFADLILRAYLGSSRPVEIFAWSWVIASLVASFVAIASGRTERLRIARLQSLVMMAHFVLVSLAVIIAWSYVLHPEADAVVGVSYPVAGSADGRTAYLNAVVDRGDPRVFEPVFVLDIASGEARRLNADRWQGPWTSADGATMVWSEATPFFFRPLWRRIGGATSFRVKTGPGEAVPLPMPRNLPDFLTARDLSRFSGAVRRVIPAPGGDIFAIFWDRHLTFTSRSQGELSDTDLGAAQPRVFRGGLFLASGDLRAALERRSASGLLSLDIVDINPRTGAFREVASLQRTGLGMTQFDPEGSRLLLTGGTEPGRGGSVSLVSLAAPAGEFVETTLVKGVFAPSARFVSEGRIIASSGAPAGAWGGTSVSVFSPEGRTLLNVPTRAGSPPRLGTEMFPGILAISMMGGAVSTTLFDLSSGKTLREIPGLQSPVSVFGPTPPPGSPAARLLLSGEGKLYELPSLEGEPRLLLPRDRR